MLIELLAAAILLLSPGDQATLSTVDVVWQPYSSPPGYATFAGYAFQARRIYLNDELPDPEVVAAVLTHELVHVRQFDGLLPNPTECGASEISAYRAQAQFWNALHPDGRDDAETFAVGDINEWAQAEAQGRLEERVAYTYRAVC